MQEEQKQIQDVMVVEAVELAELELLIQEL
jgi:hypothetical protein